MPDGLDFIGAEPGGGIQAHGDLASTLLANNMNVSSLRTATTLRKDEWLQLDTALLNVARDRLRGIADLVDAGLTFDIENGLGTTVLQHETASEFTAADVSMDGITKGEGDRQTFSLVNTPLPIVHKDFQINLRTLEASRKIGAPLDTTQAEAASRQVAERLENILFNGFAAGDLFGFGTLQAQLFGYLNRTSRNTVSLAVDWDNSAITGELILADVISMIAANQADNMFGPYMLYVPGAYWTTLMEDFKANSDKTIMRRIQELPDIMDVKAADKLPANNVVLVQMTRNNVDLIRGLEPTVVQWEGQGGMVLYFKIMAIMVPRIKIDAGTQSGVCHLS